jgi:hypothetical protein
LGYTRITFPLISHEDGTVSPNLNSRFFWEDIPYGLCILKNFGQVFGVAILNLNKVPTPNIDRQIQWHQKFMPIKFIDENNKFIQETLKETGTPMR